MAGPFAVVFSGGAPSQGSTLVAVIGLGDTPPVGSVASVTQPGVTNWQLVNSSGLISGAERVEVWAAQNIGAGATDTVTITPTSGTSDASAVLLEAVNIRQVGAFVDQLSALSGAGSPVDTGLTPITTFPNELWIAGMAMRPPAVISGPTGGFGVAGFQDSGVGTPNVTAAMLTRVVNFIATAQATLAAAPAPAGWAAAMVTLLGETGLVFVCNRSPEPDEVGNVDSGARFSLRTSNTVVDRSSLNYYLGAGPAFYQGEFLPEDHPNLTFVLQTKFFSFTQPVTRSIDGVTDELIITKVTPSQIQAGSYFFGGLESPAIPEAPIMLEFTLKMLDGDVAGIETSLVADQYQLTGVEAGFMINDTGCVVRFMRNTLGDRWVTLHDARLSGFGEPVVPLVLHDWDQGQAWTYKVLWHPELNICRLYASTGQTDLASDLLLVDAQVTDFVTVPVAESRKNQPVAFFGHGHSTPTSISRWADAYLYNIVTTPIVGGVFPGEHTGFLQSDDVVKFDGSGPLNLASQPWITIPDVFDPGNIDGKQDIALDRVTLTRADIGKTFGFFRCEPEVANKITVFDFQLSAHFNKFDSSTAHTGVELFIDDGVRVARVVFLLSGNTQYVGILGTGSPAVLGSYNAIVYGWSVDTSYRLVFEPGVGVSLVQVVVNSEGFLDELLIASSTYGVLPVTRDPGAVWTPAIGLMINGVDGGDFLSSMKISRLRYSTNVVALEGPIAPVSPWLESPAATGNITSDGTDIHFDDSDTANILTLLRLEPLLNSAAGATAEFSVRVDSYSVRVPQPLLADYTWGGTDTVLTSDTSQVSVGDFIRQDTSPAADPWFQILTVNANVSVVLGGSSHPTGGVVPSSFSTELALNPIREETGVGFTIDDGTFQYALIFAEAGPPLGKIAYLLTAVDASANLVAIRAGDPSTDGTYFQIDWTKQNTYRIEKTDGIGLKVYLNDATTPVISFGPGVFSPPPSMGIGGVIIFGSVLGDRGSSSFWRHIRYSTSKGIDVAAFPVLSENEILSRFDHAINVIVEADEV